MSLVLGIEGACDARSEQHDESADDEPEDERDDENIADQGKTSTVVGSGSTLSATMYVSSGNATGS